MPPASNKPHSAGKYSGLASNLAHLGRMRHCSLVGRSCRMANDASSGVGNSSAQTVDDHVPREWEEPASEALREGWSEAEVCAEEVAAPLEPLRGDSPREPVTPSRGNCQQERRKAPSGSSSKCKARRHRDEQPAEPAASGRALFVK